MIYLWLLGPFLKKFFSVLWPLLTSCSFLLLQKIIPSTRPPGGKCNHLHLIYLLHLNLKFRQYRTSFCCGNSSVSSMPYMLFLFVRERFCLRLLSDSASRRKPLSLANSSYYQACSGLSISSPIFIWLLFSSLSLISMVFQPSLIA